MLSFPRSVWFYALFLALLTSLPYMAGAVTTLDAHQYNGAPVLPLGQQLDYQVYIASMHWAARGQWAYTLPFSHEAHTSIPLVHATYTILGAISGLFGLDVVLVYHLARFAFTFVMVQALWRFMAHFLQPALQRWLALLLATLGSGWSWLILLLDPTLAVQVSPLEFWLADAFNLFGAMLVPHFALAITLQIVIMLCLEAWLRDKRAASLVIMTAVLIYVAGMQPYTAPFWGGLIFLRAVFFWRQNHHWRPLLWLVIPVGLHLLIVAALTVTMQLDPVWTSFMAQTATDSPPPIYYLLAYLPYLLPILFALPRFLKELDQRWLLPVLWILLVLLLLYAPLPAQRRYLIGLQTPLALLAAWSLIRLPVYRFSRSLRLAAVSVYLVLVCAGFLVLWTGSVTNAISDSQSEQYFTADEVAAYNWLQSQSTPDDLVLTVFSLDGRYSGGWLGMAVGQRIYLGHWAMTAFAGSKLEAITRFYNPSVGDDWRQQFLQEIDARYIWYDPDARSTGNWEPSTATYLDPVFTNETITIYEVLS